jgi:1,4-dihydroxy-2-naphthoate polyprenyltransferase
LLTCAILVVNNLRDIDQDRVNGKHTLAVLLGVRGSRIEYALLMLLPFAMTTWMWLVQGLGPGVMLAWIALPMALRNLKMILHREGVILNDVLAGTAQTELLFACGFALGLALPAWF